MLNKIQINILSNKIERKPCVIAGLKEFFQIKESNKSMVKLMFFCDSKYSEEWETSIKALSPENIDITMVGMPRNDYIDKINIIFQSDCKYICKWDDDTFINRYVWDYMIENVSILDNPKYFSLLPSLSDGVPSTDFFIEDFLTDKESNKCYNIFLEDNIPSVGWGVNFNMTRNFISKLDKWDPLIFWKHVSEINCGPFYRKGIHPARFSVRYHEFLVEYTKNNLDKLYSNQQFYLHEYFTPYFCNNLNITLLDNLKKSIETYGWMDGFDEVQMNLLCQSQNQTPIYIRNCFGVQMAYGCVGSPGPSQSEKIENLYYNNVFK